MFDPAHRVARRAEGEPVGVDVVGDARGPVVGLLGVRPAPVIAAVAGAAHVALAAVL